MKWPMARGINPEAGRRPAAEAHLAGLQAVELADFIGQLLGRR